MKSTSVADMFIRIVPPFFTARADGAAFARLAATSKKIPRAASANEAEIRLRMTLLSFLFSSRAVEALDPTQCETGSPIGSWIRMIDSTDRKPRYDGRRAAATLRWKRA
jgi:hypothetical protein